MSRACYETKNAIIMTTQFSISIHSKLHLNKIHAHIISAHDSAIPNQLNMAEWIKKNTPYRLPLGYKPHPSINRKIQDAMAHQMPRTWPSSHRKWSATSKFLPSPWDICLGGWVDVVQRFAIWQIPGGCWGLVHVFCFLFWWSLGKNQYVRIRSG